MIAKIKDVKYAYLLSKEKRKPNTLMSKFCESNSLFVHIPKTGGMSIVASVYGDVDGGGHPDVLVYRNVFKKEFDNMFKYTVVRNPYSRLQSAFNFMKAGGLHEGDRKWAEMNLKGFDTLESFVLGWLSEENVNKAIHFRPQYKFVCDSNGELLVDFVMKNEKLSEDFEKLKSKLGVVSELKEINKTQVSTDDDFSPEMKEKVKKVFRKDFELFGYEG